MKKFVLTGIAAGITLIIFGISARTQGQTALSTAVIAAGILISLFVGVLFMIFFFKNKKGSGFDL